MYQSRCARSRGEPLGVARDHLLGGEEAGGRGHLRHDRVALLGQVLVDDQQPDVGERVAQRRHLPVDDGGDAVERGREHDVGQPVVAVHDRRAPTARAASRRAARRCGPARRAGGSRTPATAGASAGPAGPGTRPGGRTRPARPRPGRPRAGRPGCPSAARRSGWRRPGRRRAAAPACRARRRRRSPSGRTARPARPGPRTARRPRPPARRCRRSALITVYSRTMSWAVGSTCASGGRRSAQVVVPSVIR